MQTRVPQPLVMYGLKGFKAGKPCRVFPHYPVVTIFSLQAGEPVSVGGEVCDGGSVGDSGSEEDGRWTGTVRFRSLKASQHLGVHLLVKAGAVCLTPLFLTQKGVS